MTYRALVFIACYLPLFAYGIDTKEVTDEIKHQWGELTEFSKTAYHKGEEIIDGHMHPDPPNPIMPPQDDMKKSCSELYYEMSGLSVYSTDAGPQLLSNPYDFMTDPINRAAIVGGSYFSTALYYVIPVNGIMADKRNRTVTALKHRQEMLRTVMARKQCYQ